MKSLPLFALLLCLCLALLFPPTPLAAEEAAADPGVGHGVSGGPDAFGYTYEDTVEFGGPYYDFQDISATGTPILLADDAVSGAISIGFSFTFYGTSYANLYVSSNGFLKFAPLGSAGCCAGQALPSAATPNGGLIAAWWNDLNPALAPNSVRYQTLGSVPNRRFIVQFTNVPHTGNVNPVTFQIKLFESGNVIEVHYQSAPAATGQHSAGIENQAGTIGLTYFFGSGSLTTPVAVRYTPPQTPARCAGVQDPFYICKDIGYLFENIAATGTPLVLADDEVATITPGFPFYFYDTSYTTLFVSSNGLLKVDNGDGDDGCCAGQTLPNPAAPNGGIIAGWWDDLDPSEGGTVHYQVVGTAPLRRLIVQFTDVEHVEGGDPVTFQFQVYEDSNIVEVHYQSVPSDGSLHAAGIENQGGSSGLQYYLDTASLPAYSAVRYLSRNRYVSTTGSDTGNHCGALRLPCATITKAITQTSPGNRILVAGGNYPEEIKLNKDLTVEHWAGGGGGNDWAVTGVALTEGLLIAPPGAMELAANFEYSGGTFQHNNATVRFGGASTQELTLNLPTTFYTLTVGLGTTLIETVSDDNATVAGALNNLDTIRKSQTVVGTGPITFGLTEVSLSVTTRGTLDTIQIDRRAGNHPNAHPLLMTGQYWDITETGAGFLVDNLTFPHNTLPNPSVCSYNGDRWYCDRSTFTPTTVSRNGVTHFSSWTVGNDTPLVVQLDQFAATSAADHVQVMWVTMLEVNTRGFNLYRSTQPTPPAMPLTAALIPAQAPGGQGASYQWRDEDVTLGTTYFYWLEEVDQAGLTAWHGPVSVTHQGTSTLTLAHLDTQPHAAPASLFALLALAALTLACVRRAR